MIIKSNSEIFKKYSLFKLLVIYIQINTVGGNRYFSGVEGDELGFLGINSQRISYHPLKHSVQFFVCHGFKVIKGVGSNYYTGVVSIHQYFSRVKR